MKGTVISLLLGVTASLVSSAPPDGYEYAWTSFGKVDPQTLQPSISLASGDQFGRVVVMTDGLAAVSSNEMAVDPSTGEAGFQGKVFLFYRDYLLQWIDSGQYFISNVHNDGFGTSLALHGTMLAVGAPKDSSNGENRGKVYIYSGSTFNSLSVTSIAGSEHAADNDYFGHSVAITHGFTDYYGTGTVVVGAYGHNKDKEHEEAGCVFIFAQTAAAVWTQVGVIEPAFPVDHAGFGYSVASYGNALVVGSYGSDHAHVFELHGHLHECPHAGPDHQEDLPAECQDSDDAAGDDAAGDDASSAAGAGIRRLRSRALQGGPPDEDKTYYSEWKYEEVLMLGFENREGHRPEDKNTIQHFGSSVAIYNSSGVLTVAIGCSECVTENNIQVGAVYIFSKLAISDAAVGWYPDDYHPKEEAPKRRLQDEDGGDSESESEGDSESESEEKDEKQEQEEQQREEARRFLWDPAEHSSHASRDGDYWFLENSFWGRIQYEHFGWSISVDRQSLLVGTNPTTYLQGRAEVYARMNINEGSPDYVQSGPLYNTAWRWVSNLQDKSGITGDKYGYSVALYNNDAIVGSILSGLQEDGSFGSGAAYVYQKRYLKKKESSAVSPEKDESETMFETLSDPHTAIGISFLSSSTVIVACAVLALFYGVYRATGGELSPKELLLGTSGRSDVTKSMRPLHLSSALDDSTSSVGSNSSRSFMGPGQGGMSAYSGLNTSSSHGAKPSGQFKPRQQYVPKGPPKPSYSPAKGRGTGLDDL